MIPNFVRQQNLPDQKRKPCKSTKRTTTTKIINDPTIWLGENFISGRVDVNTAAYLPAPVLGH